MVSSKGVYALVRGIPGSGKTWLCKELTAAGIMCLDTDDLLHAMFIHLYETSDEFRALIDKNANWWELLAKKTKAKLQRVIKQAKVQRKSLVVVGVTLGVKIPGLDTTYFMRLSKASLERTYRRLAMRELRKITDRIGEITDIIETKPVARVGPLLYNTINPATDIAMSFASYENMYQNALKSEKEREAIILSQPEILRRLTSGK